MQATADKLPGMLRLKPALGLIHRHLKSYNEKIGRMDKRSDHRIRLTLKVFCS